MRWPMRFYRFTLVRSLTLITAMALAQLVSGQAAASDGVLEINQVCATTTGCFPGDSGGFPVTIASPGSYVLTGALEVSSSSDGIRVDTDDVTLDLGGFDISGPGVCSGTTGAGISCPSATVGPRGIDAEGRDRLVVHSGRISGFPDVGIHAERHARLRDLHVESNGLGGIETNDFADIRHVTAIRNGGTGVQARSFCIVESVIGADNLGRGIDGNNGCTMRGLTAHGNGDDGIRISNGSTLLESSSYDNDGDGVQMSSASLAKGVVLYRNGSASDFQIRASSLTAAFKDCVIDSGGPGGLTSTVTHAGGSTCDGTPCP